MEQPVIPPELQQAFAQWAAQMGLAVPGLDRIAPTINLSQAIRGLAHEIGQTAAPHNIFLKGGAVVFLDLATGKTSPATARKLPSWLEEFVAFKSSKPGRGRESLAPEEAGQILETKIFQDCLRPLSAVHTVRLPVRRADGRIEFLSPGYDQESAIYTLELIPYAMDWSIEQAREWLKEVCCEVPWNGLEEQAGDLDLNRSFAVHVAAIVGTYCSGMFPAGTLRPMFAYFANKPGTGKTRMAEMALVHVYGPVGGTTVPKEEDKMDVKLETVARAQRPWVVFDDIGGQLRSNSLNKFITETVHTGRCFGSNSEFFEVENVTQVFVTANDLPTSEDIGRRALVAELFLAEEVRGRKFKQVITSAWLALPETRGRFLSACCAIIRHWEARSAKAGRPLLHPQPLETFEEWSGLIAALVMTAGFADPLQRAEMDVGGASTEDEIKRLLVSLATRAEQDCEFTRAELVNAARDAELLESLVGLKGEPDLDAAASKRFGRQFQRWRGQRMLDERGRAFQFNRKHRKSGASYPLTFS